MSSSHTPATRRILALFEKYGETDYIGEPLSVLEHSIQAAQAAKAFDEKDSELMIAALLHDIGHAIGMEAGKKMEMDGCGVTNHEHIGADFALKLGFSERVAKLIRNHVSAKRYLCYKQADYHAKLTDASKTTLRFQGGPMSADEAAAFEADPDFRQMLVMRTFDESAKDPVSSASSLESYAALLDDLSRKSPLAYNPQHEPSSTTPKVPEPVEASTYSKAYTLSQCQLDFWQENGYLKVTNLLSYENVTPTEIDKWVDEIAAWPKTEGKWLLHWEMTEKGRTLSRAENFTDYHAGLRSVCDTALLPLVSQLFGEQAVLFKEKINFKLPGGAGFAAHQDSPAYIGMTEDHISVMVAVDASTKENGCLQVAGGRWSKGCVPLTAEGIIEPAAEAQIAFQHAECSPGDVLFFGGYTPHRSNGNSSERSRRALFMTYNPASQGDHKTAYYEAKHKGALGFDGAQTLSFQGDFRGKIVE